MKRLSIIKQVLAVCLIFLMSINSFAAVVSDNDGSAFVTKAEFDALKSSFAKQIDDYNSSIDGKIDGAIASYLSGIQLATYELIKLDAYQNLEFPVYSCVGKESSKHTYKENGDKRFDLSLPLVELQKAEIHTNYSHTKTTSGFVPYRDHSSGTSPKGSGMTLTDIMLVKTHGDPVVGKYEAAYWDVGLGAWRTNGYRKGYIKLGSEFLVQDLPWIEQEDNWSRSSVYSQIDATANPDYRKFWYPCMCGSTELNLKETTNSSVLTKWYGNELWTARQAGWNGLEKSKCTANHSKLMENFDGRNLTLTQYKKMCDDISTVWTTGGCDNSIDTGVKTRIDQESKRNKIYSGASAYVNAFPESNVWCYNPVKIGSDWKSDEYFMLRKTDIIMTVNDASSYFTGKGIVPYDPYFSFLVPALDGDTDDTNYGKDARFSIINADKLYWTDTNGENHKFNEGLFITKTSKNGSLQGRMKFSESSNEKVWCAFSKKPFDGSWTDNDALSVTINGAKRDKTNLLFDCNTDYSFKVDGLQANDKIYMCFKSSSGSKNPSLDMLDDLVLILEN